MNRRTLRGLLAFVAVGFFYAGSISGQSQVTLRETERRLVMIPFLNATGDSKLDYLSPGIPRLLSNKLESIPFVRGVPSVTFSARNRSGVGLPDKESQAIPLPLSVKLRNEKEWPAYAEGRKPAEVCAKLSGHYWAGGRFTKADTKIQVTAVLHDCTAGRTQTITWSDDEPQLYANIDKPAENLRALLLGEDPVKLKVVTPEPGAMVYLDGAYLGRTPVDTLVIRGGYTLRIEQEGRATISKRVELSAREYELSETAEIRRSRGGLSIQSDPPGAQVYLDMRYLGVTPLEKTDLESGTHRLRISLEKHVDRFVGVRISEGNTTKVNVILKEGDSLAFYKDPGEPIRGWTYHDLSFYSAITSLGFYLGWLDLEARADRIEDSVKTYVPLIASFQRVAALGQGTISLSEAAWETYLVDQNRLAVLRAHRRANAVGSLGIGMFGFSIFCLYQGIVHDDKEGGEVLFMGSHVRPMFLLMPDDRLGRGYAWTAGLSVRF
ncbi:MAG: PEGA domain-containing protein [Spirochaetia bacterium]|nr:PEGA domain-containing protein [Spirochaetia bacterium]